MVVPAGAQKGSRVSFLRQIRSMLMIVLSTAQLRQSEVSRGIGLQHLPVERQIAVQQPPEH